MRGLGCRVIPAFKDFLKKSKEATEKDLKMVSDSMELDHLLKDFDEVVATT